MALTRTNSPDDPQEGSNVTLICRNSGFYVTSPEWAYLNTDTGDLVSIQMGNRIPEGNMVKKNSPMQSLVQTTKFCGRFLFTKYTRNIF